MLLWIRVLFAPTVDRFTRPITSRIAGARASTLAALVALAGILWWAGITWWYADMFSAMFAMQGGRFAGPDGTRWRSGCTQTASRTTSSAPALG
jgi:hypothetical protein